MSPIKCVYLDRTRRQYLVEFNGLGQADLYLDGFLIYRTDRQGLERLGLRPIFLQKNPQVFEADSEEYSKAVKVTVQN